MSDLSVNLEPRLLSCKLHYRPKATFISALKVALPATLFNCIQAEVAVDIVLVVSTDCLLSLQFVKGKQCRIAIENRHPNVETNQNGWPPSINLIDLVS